MRIERITVLADRDEFAEDGKKPSFRGEQSARKLCLRLHKGIKCDIAMPGEPETKTDVLDILQAGGVDAVRELVASAVPFEPSEDEVRLHAERVSQEERLSQATRSFPLPHAIGHDLKHKLWDNDVIIVKEVAKGSGNEKTVLPVCSLFSINGRVRYIDNGDASGLRIEIQDMAGGVRVVDIPRDDLARNRGSEIKASLFAAGLRTFNGGESTVIDILKSCKPEREILIVSRPGWHKPNARDPFYVAPGGQVIGGDTEIELAAGLALEEPTKGTIQGQLDTFETAVSVENAQHWQLSTAAGGIGVINDLLSEETSGFCMSGPSSVGKTLGQRQAASWWGSTKSGEGMLKPLKTTDNAIEGLAQQASGSILALDELAHADPRTLGQMIYLLSGNQGKARFDKGMRQRRPYRWSTGALLSSETGLRSKVEAGGGTWVAGMSVRIVDIKVAEVNSAAPADTIDKIESGLRENFGHIGPAFVQRFVEEGLHRDPDAVRAQVNRLAKEIANGFDEESGKEDAAGIDRRAARPFAVTWMVGEMAKEWGLLPDSCDIRGAIEWGWRSFKDSAEAEALNPVERAISNIQEWVQSRWDVTIKPTKALVNQFGDLHTNNREADGWYDDTAVYIPKNKLAIAAGKILTETDVARVLDAKGMLASKHKDGKRLCVRYVPMRGHLDAYALSRTHFGVSGRAADIQVAEGEAA